MYIINRKLSLSDFKAYISSFNFAPLSPSKIVLHHTWKPTVDQWQGQRSINGLKSFYERKGWSAGPHLFIGEDGIWLFTPMNTIGIHAGVGNTKSIGIEVVGDYDEKVWEGAIKDNVVGVLKALMEKLNITTTGLHFHNEYSPKSCPGKMITKQYVLSLLSEEISPKRKELEDRLQLEMEEVHRVLNKANATRKELCKEKGIPTKQYSIIDNYEST